MTDGHQTIELALVASIPLADLGDVMIDIAEVGLDRLLAETVAREVPIIGTLVHVGKAVGAVRDHLFAKKVARFLLAASDVPPEERKRFVHDLDDDGRKRLRETLVLLLDRLDDLQKPRLVARFFAEYMKGVLTFDQFQRLSTSVDRMFLADLPLLTAFYRESPRMSRDPHPEHERLSHLALAGLVEMESAGGYVGGGPGHYRQTSLGRTFVTILAAVA